MVVADRLISKEILALASCEIKIANKMPACAEMAQEELNYLVVEVVLIDPKIIGDSFLFGREGEENIEYSKHGIKAEMLLGLFCSYAAPLVSNIPLTRRGVSNKVHKIVLGHLTSCWSWFSASWSGYALPDYRNQERPSISYEDGFPIPCVRDQCCDISLEEFFSHESADGSRTMMGKMQDSVDFYGQKSGNHSDDKKNS
ncbi:hypothetical protein EON65_25100 [archaeon]|nr:MAG: hypothetical protein EON65_25100 [archaeon]